MVRNLMTINFEFKLLASQEKLKVLNQMMNADIVIN